MNASRLAAWLLRVPDSAVRLELRYEAISGVQTLYTWQRNEIDHAQTAANLIEAIAQDHCEDAERRTRYECAWLDKDNRVLATKGIRCEPTEQQQEPLVGAGNAPREDPTIGGLTALLMRHLENRERLSNVLLSTNVKVLVDQIRDARAENDQLRQELRLVRQQLRAKEDGDDEETTARADAITRVADAVVTHLVPVAAARMREGMQ